MSKLLRPNLKSIVAGNFEEPAIAAAPEPVAVQPAQPELLPPATNIVDIQPQPKAMPIPTQPAKRAGEGTLKERAKQLSVYLEEPVYDQLRDLAYTERKKLHGLVLEGLDLLFKKRGLKPLSSLTKPVAK